MTTSVISTTVKIDLKPWSAPNYAIRTALATEAESATIPVSDLDDDALEDLALAWVRDLYLKAGKRHCPFYKPAKAMRANAA